jgi:hypothetical protein
MSRASGLAAGLSSSLLEGEDDALAGVAAFKLVVGLSGLLHGHGFARAQAEPAIGQQGDRLIQGPGARSFVGWESVTPKSGAAVSDKVMTRSGSPVSAIASARVVVFGDRADHLDPLGNRELRRDDADRSAAADQQQRLTALDAQLPEDTGGRLGRAGQRGSIDPRHRVRLAGPDRRHRVLGVTAQAEQQRRDGVAGGRAGDAPRPR